MPLQNMSPFYVALYTAAKVAIGPPPSAAMHTERGHEGDLVSGQQHSLASMINAIQVKRERQPARQVTPRAPAGTMAGVALEGCSIRFLQCALCQGG